MYFNHLGAPHHFIYPVPDIGLPVSFGVAARRRRPIGTPDLPKQAYLRSCAYQKLDFVEFVGWRRAS